MTHKYVRCEALLDLRYRLKVVIKDAMLISASSRQILLLLPINARYWIDQ